MPCRPSAKNLRQLSLDAVAHNLELLCYGAPKGSKELANIIQHDAFKTAVSPFEEWPSGLLEDLSKAVYHHRAGLKHLLYPVIQPQINAYSIELHGSIYVALELVSKRCKNLKKINIRYSINLPPHFYIDFFRHFSYLTHIDLYASVIDDPSFGAIAEFCPRLVDLNAARTEISNQGLLEFAQESEDGTSRCPNLRIINLSSTRISPEALSIFLAGRRKTCCRLEHPETFQAFKSLQQASGGHPAPFSLTNLTSTAIRLTPEVFDSAIDHCPNVDSVIITSCGLSDSNLYRLMSLKRLSSLHLGNLMADNEFSFYEGLVPILQEVGPRLKRLVLEKFLEIDIVAIGQNCPGLKHLAMSNITAYAPVANHDQDLFQHLDNLELWCSANDFPISPSVVRQLLYSCHNLTKLLFKNVKCVDDSLLQEIWERNPMTALETMVFDQIYGITKSTLWLLLTIPNQLTILRCWNCVEVTSSAKDEIKAAIEENNLTLYWEWYPWAEPTTWDDEESGEESGDEN